MKIACGVKNIKEAFWAFENGVDEVYFSYKSIPNHRRTELSVQNFLDAVKIIKLGVKKNKITSLVYNGDDINYDLRYFRKNIFPLITEFVYYGLKRLIIKDVYLMEILRDMGLKIGFNLSSLSLVFNSHSLDFFKKYKISRIVLPLHLSCEESIDLIKNAKKNKMETEFFYYPNHNCQNVDPLCDFCDLKHKGCKITYNKNFFMPIPSVYQMAEHFYSNYMAGAEYIKIPRTLSFYKTKKAVLDIGYLAKTLKKNKNFKIFRDTFLKTVNVSLSV